jgi:hypothetical protein
MTATALEQRFVIHNNFLSAWGYGVMVFRCDGIIKIAKDGILYIFCQGKIASGNICSNESAFKEICTIPLGVRKGAFPESGTGKVYCGKIAVVKLAEIKRAALKTCPGQITTGEVDIKKRMIGEIGKPQIQTEGMCLFKGNAERFCFDFNRSATGVADKIDNIFFHFLSFNFRKYPVIDFEGTVP